MPLSDDARTPHNAPIETSALVAALLAGGLSVAGHVLGKAVRDALYLATFPVELLPYFLLATGVVSAVAVGVYTRLNTRVGPSRVVPALGLLSAATLPPLWVFARAASPAAIAVLFVWTTLSGTLLTSGFWAVLGERFDPRRARRLFGWAAVATTVGGLVGGLGARAALRFMGPEELLLVLAGIDVALALALLRLGAPRADADQPPAAREDLPSRARGGLTLGLREVASTKYLRDIALLIAIGTIAGTIADYVLKDAASHALAHPALGSAADGKRGLAEFFALFHGGVAAVTLAVQVLVARPLVHKKGIGAALIALPIWLTGGALAFTFAPFLWAATALRGGENAVRNSFHRSGYELLFVPLPAMTKRLVKPILDTLLERAADGVGAGLILVAVGVLGMKASGLGLVISVLGAAQILLVLRVRRGYVATLSANLVARSVELDAAMEAADDDATARETIRTTLLDAGADDLRSSVAESEVGRSLMRSLEMDMPDALRALRGEARDANPRGGAGPRSVVARPRGVIDDDALEVVLGLADLDARSVRRALGRWDGRDHRAVPFLVTLLARDDVHLDAARALMRAGDRFAGALADHLDDDRAPFAVRRRLPRVLAACDGPKAIGALTRALGDARFEVRYHAAEALARIDDRVGRRPAAAVVWAAVEREVKKSRQMWEAQTLLEPDAGAAREADPLAGVVERRGAHSLRHVFRLLGLVLDAPTLQLAYRAVHSGDAHFRGVGLEYLENILPPAVKAALWPLIGDDDAPAPPESRAKRALAEVLEELASSGTLPRPRLSVVADEG